MPRFNKHIIIVGTARSGTSWLSETMAQTRRYRMLFEPEQETRTKLGYLLCDQWLTKPSDSKAAHNYLKQVFANRVDCDWIAQNSNRNYKMHLWPLLPKKFIIKFVRCNLSAHYMNTAFGIPVVHVIRNPYEVLASQSRVNFPWLVDLSYFKSQKELVAFIQKEFNLDIIISSNYTDLQLKTLRWCIENIIPLHVLEVKPSKNYRVVKYEDLVADTNVFCDICEEFNIEYSKDIERIIALPSSKAHSKGTLSNSKTRDSLFSASELKEINMILDIFGMNMYPKITG
ncbi:MAG: sulfotransferase domain-containing protein [Psychroserpens sp.]|uniref:sulfotransferase domain-containing protein n=1 Tax=Psychroserpens sp. TaxID=2020870 RepID=UPI003CC3B78A